MNYFLRPDGDDNADGTSPRTAWRTLEHASRQQYRPGDSLRLRGGATFMGGLKFTPENVAAGGDGRRFVTVESYGGGRATIQAADSDGVFVEDLGGFVVGNLKVVGSGRGKDKHCGVQFYNTRGGAVKLPYVRIENVEASRFAGAGIQIGASPADNSKSGFRDVLITKCVAFENVYHGIHVWGAWDVNATTYAHENVVVSYCVAHGNAGDPEYKENHSGNGIIVSDTDGGRIEYCTAYNNGAFCNNPGGGPIGIWAHASNRIIIQFCASFNNRTGRSVDGGGFDFDGGVSNSILQYNYSGGNDGAGYLLYAYAGSPYTFRDNVVRYNISENDGRRNRFGMIHVDTGGPEVRDIALYHNTIITSPSPTGNPFGILVANATDVRLGSNLIVTEGGVPLLELGDKIPGFRALGNAYWSETAPFILRETGKEYRSLAEWRNATNHERLNGHDTGKQSDPRLNASHLPKPPRSASDLPRIRAFRPRPDSPLVHAALDLKAAFGAEPAPHDFRGTPLPRGRAATIGALEPI